jgi:hypothetical protein
MESKKDSLEEGEIRRTPELRNDKPDSSIKNSKADFENMVEFYLASNPIVSQNRKMSELEIRFGTNSKVAKPISKIDYENVVKQLYSSGFTTTDSKGLHTLRINNEYYDVRKEITKISNIRAEIVGVDMIQEYCKSNSIQKLLDMPSTVSALGPKIKFTQKSPPMINNDKPLRPVDFIDFNFRASYQMEQDYGIQSNIARNIINKWSDSKKIFRHINRVRFSHDEFPIFADISILKGSKKIGRVPVPEYTIQEAGVFENIESYEVELEIDNSKVGVGTKYDTTPKLLDAIRKCIRIVLGALQGTNYPIAYSERDRILQSYMKLIHGDTYEPRRVITKDFIGPSSYTLQLENISKNSQSAAPKILNNYTVTDKADGERKLLYISENGRIYMIDSNMNVIFTGAYTNEKTLYDSLMDGEHIKYDKYNKYVNLYAAFDVYYIHKKSVRELAFTKSSKIDEELAENLFRLNLLKRGIALLEPRSILDTGKKDTTNPCEFSIKCKEFYKSSEDSSIFEACSSILSNINQGLYPYNTDGLIFTPANTGVGSDTIGIAGPLYKSTWEQSFKWKPADFNTIDFLVSVKKDKNGKDEIHNVFQEGKNVGAIQDIVQYKTLVLRCGFDANNHRFMNPFEDVINDNLPNQDVSNEERYKPVPFQPTDPYDPNACYCNVLLHKDGNGDLYMKTEEGEYFEEDNIVEFKYDISLEGAWKWVPLRMRYDKTAELRAGMRNYGNAYHVANSNWHSIHNPITENMIMTGNGIPEEVEDSDVYYNRSSKDTSTKALRDFHNLYVKKKLILGVSNRKDTLIDYAVGKGGDLPKWIRANLSFVLGIDVSRDNIQNSLDGACARYLKSFKKNNRNELPGAIFLQGNSGVNIRNGKAFMTEKEKMIARALFGSGPKDRKELKEGVYKNYGVGHDGFNVSSCQFALHYFFENNTTFHSFLRNLTECTKIGGYFVGTCYDGKVVFEKLKNKNKGESVSIMRDDKKMYEITKMYDETGFPDDELSIGYTINVYQESINKTFAEYLVNFNYFIRMMENYGFVLATKEQAEKMDLPNGTALFDELYNHMTREIEREPNKSYDYGTANKMTTDEKWISFMNRYFVFNKVRSVDSEKIYNQFLKKTGKMEENEEIDDLLKLKEDEKKEQKEEEKPIIKIRKLNKKIVLDKYSPIEEEDVDVAPLPPLPQAVPMPKIVLGESVKIMRPKK